MNSQKRLFSIAVMYGIFVLAAVSAAAYACRNEPISYSAATPNAIAGSPDSPAVAAAEIASQSASAAKNAIEASNQFACDLYLRYFGRKSANQNIFFSPFSISSALTMTFEGAQGKTADEILKVFHLPVDVAQIRKDYQEAYGEINAGDKLYTLRTANALWVRSGYKLLGDYINTVKTYYDGRVTSLDFSKNPGNAVNTINNWVAEKTANRITNLLSNSDVNPTTRLILTNAIYFKGLWIDKFAKAETENREFTPGSGTPYKVPMMKQVSQFRHAELKNVQLLELPYQGSALSMLVILPQNNNLASVEKTLSSSKLAEWVSSLENHRVDVSLPKFKIETRESLAADLEAMGMPMAFSPREADFSGIALRTSMENLFIGSVIHQTFIENNEDGTEAAAATAVGVQAAIAVLQPPQRVYVFNANHPFIFLIRQNRSGSILFMGRITKP